MKKGFQTRALSDFFAAKTLLEVVEHEMVHKRHRDKVKLYYESNKQRFDTIEDAKQELEADLRKYVVTKRYENPNYLEQMGSDNAYNGMIRVRRLNELIADGTILIERGGLKDEGLCRLIEEVLS